MNTTSIITAAGQSASHAGNIGGVAGGTVGLAALIAFGWLFHATHGHDKSNPGSGRGAFLKSGKFKVSVAFALGALAMTGGGFIANIFTHASSIIG
jgi:hypothetical protein